MSSNASHSRKRVTPPTRPGAVLSAWSTLYTGTDTSSTRFATRLKSSVTSVSGASNGRAAVWASRAMPTMAVASSHDSWPSKRKKATISAIFRARITDSQKKYCGSYLSERNDRYPSLPSRSKWPSLQSFVAQRRHAVRAK